MTVKITLTAMTIRDYEEVYALWQKSEGVSLQKADDSRPAIAAYLKRNRGLSFTARAESKVVGAVLGGHDGRRGYLHHLAVDEAFRDKGIGKRLAKKTLEELKKLGIHKCHVFVYGCNTGAQAFWEKIGWGRRGDIVLMSRNLDKGRGEKKSCGC